MSTTHTRVNLVAAAIAGVAAPAMLLLGAGTAQAAPGPDGTVGIGNPNDRPQARVFNPQPDPPAFSHPGNLTGLGGPDTIPSPNH